ncbi:helix-turn-helix domain-containing protein [Clostridium cadaveris]|uniref:helix-turn-helix domain-containing protein n=1 Tax=Clostridium cadaveris TaxID=1529 RepID=UPI00041DA2A6|nr:helix-turn-helix transcriptional regulator [Clostridium cadaveris]NWK12114.1 helix-turn-helix transcriptional regulator [Clostridium cadaveris]
MFNRNLILKLLEAKGWTKYKLAKESGIPQSSLHDILSGKIKNPTGERLKSIADALGVSVDAFFDDNAEEEKSEEKTIEKDFPIVPEHFTNPDEARAYVTKHQIFGYGGFNPYIMSDEDILNFANEMIEQAELLGYKYSRKQKK